jgi:hypothetical protein
MMILTPGWTDDLAAFLTACLDEKESLARRILASEDQDPAFMLDPDEALREVEAGRKILDAWHDNELERPDDDSLSYTGGLADGLRLTVLYFAAAYSDRPGYRPEWSPDGP